MRVGGWTSTLRPEHSPQRSHVPGFRTNSRFSPPSNPAPPPTLRLRSAGFLREPDTALRLATAVFGRLTPKHSRERSPSLLDLSRPGTRTPNTVTLSFRQRSCSYVQNDVLCDCWHWLWRPAPIPLPPSPAPEQLTPATYSGADCRLPFDSAMATASRAPLPGTRPSVRG